MFASAISTLHLKVASRLTNQFPASKPGKMYRVSLAMAALILSLTQAAYVDLFRDADFKHRLRRVDNIVLDRCYNLACGDLNNVITSAKWEGVESFIAFYADTGCPSGTHHWYQTRFPSDFRLDRIGYAISSFMVLNKGAVTSHWNLCTTELSTLDATNESCI